MTHSAALTPHEREVQLAMTHSIVDEARRHGIPLSGIDYPAIAVKDAIAEWLVAARNYKPLPAYR